jgi:hypothetical protein
MTQKIQMRRGLRADLPVLDEGEFGFCIDAEELYIGSTNGNLLFAKASLDGSVLKLGDLQDVDTSGLIHGDILQYNDNNGNWEAVRNSGGTGGGASNLSDLADVDTTGLVHGDLLQYNDNNGMWEVAPASAGGVSSLDDLDDVDTNTIPPAEGNVLKYVGGAWQPGTVSSSGGGTIVSGGVNAESFNVEPIGELYFPVSNYTAWCPASLKYDKNRGVFVELLRAADHHVVTTAKNYFITIDPDTLVSSKPVEITLSNGVLDTNAGTNHMMVLNDGSYMFIASISSNPHRITSTDGGNTWYDQGAITCDQSLAGHGLWSMYLLSSGRLIAGFTTVQSDLIYSDNNGASWKYVTVDSDTGGVFEPNIIEVSPGKLICLQRRSMGGNDNGPNEPAKIAFSNDNGATWTTLTDSQSILNMNASGSTAYVHDGIVDLFTISRFGTTTQASTGKAGALYHYTATVQNALQDNFTLKEIVLYAHTTNMNDFHSPCLAVDDKNRMLLVYFDKSQLTDGNEATHQYVRGALGYIPYTSRNKKSSSVYTYSGSYIDAKFNEFSAQINSLKYRLSLMAGSNVIAPTNSLFWVNGFNAQDQQTYLFNDTVFSTLVYFPNKSIGGYNSLGVDSAGVTYHDSGNGFCFTKVVSKPNFSISFKGTGGYNSTPVACIINGIGYGFFNAPTINNGEAVHTYRLEYWAGTLKTYIDDIRVPASTFAINTMAVYDYFLQLVPAIDNTKKYMISGFGSLGGTIYDLRYGEWGVGGATTDTTPPSDVTNLTVSNTTSTSTTLSWSASSSTDVASYDVFNGTTLLGNTTSATYNVSSLSPSTVYTFNVKAKDSSGNVASGTSVQVTTIAAATAPNDVTGLSTSNVGATTLTLTWTAPTGATSYDVYRGATLLGNVTAITYAAAGLTASTAYTFKVVAKNSIGSAPGTGLGATVNVTTATPDTTAPTITASPVGGSYSAVQTVSLTSNETPTTIYYTLDGSAPTTASSVYSTPLTISGNTTLKYFGRDASGNSSAVQTQTYTISVRTFTPIGTVVNSPATFSTTISTNTSGGYDDNAWATSDFGFDFPFYDSTIRNMYVGSNSYIITQNLMFYQNFNAVTPASAKGIFIAGADNRFTWGTSTSLSGKSYTYHFEGDNAGGTKQTLCWEVTFFADGVIQLVTGDAAHFIPKSGAASWLSNGVNDSSALSFTPVAGQSYVFTPNTYFTGYTMQTGVSYVPTAIVNEPMTTWVGGVQ